MSEKTYVISEGCRRECKHVAKGVMGVQQYLSKRIAEAVRQALGADHNTPKLNVVEVLDQKAGLRLSRIDGVEWTKLQEAFAIDISVGVKLREVEGGGINVVIVTESEES